MAVMEFLTGLTRGEWLYYGGYVGMALDILLIPLVVQYFRRKKRKTAQKIEDEF